MGATKYNSPAARAAIRAHIRTFIETCPLEAAANEAADREQRFIGLALDLFLYQFEKNAPYRALCLKRGRTPATVRSIDEIPAVMAGSFKHLPLFCGDPETQATRVFYSSGTTAQRRGRHYFRSLDIYRTASLRTFKWACLPDAARMPILVLGPAAEAFPHSSLGQMFSWIAEAYGTPANAVCFSDRGIDVRAAQRWLSARAVEKTPVMLLATSLALLDFIEACDGWKIKLAAGSRIIDTGGYKASGRTTSRPAFLDAVSLFFGLNKEWIFNEYGMTEMSSQLYETRFLQPRFGVGLKVAPPWVRCLACDPETLAPLAPGETGALRYFDLANVDSVAMLQSEDFGRVRGRTVRLLGRAPDAEPRGCSLLTEEIRAVNLQG